MALYKKNEDGSWLKAEVSVFTPLSEITKDNLSEGWEYYDHDPVEYTEYIRISNTSPMFDINPILYVQE